MADQPIARVDPLNDDPPDMAAGMFRRSEIDSRVIARLDQRTDQITSSLEELHKSTTLLMAGVLVIALATLLVSYKLKGLVNEG